jgi:hypothetical protein
MKNAIARCGMPDIGTTGSISIRVSHETRHWRTMQLKTIVECALEIAKNTLYEGTVRLPRIMHEKTDLLNSICNICPGEGEILKSTCKTMIMSGVLNRRAIEGKHVLIGVVQDLQSTIPGRARISNIYCL